MGTITTETRQRGRKVFRAEVRREGQRLTKRFTRKTDAQDWISKTESKIVDGEQVPKLKRYTLGDAIERYTAEILPHKRLGTAKLHTAQLERIKKLIGHIKLAKLSSGDLAYARSELAKEVIIRPHSDTAVKRGGSTLNRYFQPLSHCLRIAQRDWGWIKDVPRLTRLPEPKGRTRFLSPDEAKVLFAALDKDRRKDVRLICLICLMVGSRLQETCALRWQDIDFDSKVIHFHVTKTGVSRTVPVPPQLLAELANWKSQRGESDCLFPTKKKSRFPYIYDSVKKRFAKITSDLGLREVVIHSLRHTAASWATQQNVNRKTIADLLGHAHVSTTDRYAHLTVEHLRPVVDAVEHIFLAPPKTESEEVVH